jgi:ethanolaminephosphotransferase
MTDKQSNIPLLHSESKNNEEVEVAASKQEQIQPNSYNAEDRGFLVGKLTPYLSAEARANLPHYKYRAADNGIVYQKFFNPFGNYVVTLLPNWLAANVITFVGFLFSITPYTLMVIYTSSHFYNPAGMTDLPAWLFYSKALFYFIYRFLDEIDGKQARRTGNASPLGLLFDHGFDAYSLGMITAFFCKGLQVGDNIHSLLVMNIVNFVFHVTTVEQYMTGELILSLGNFVSDGVFPFCFLFALTGYVGNSWWVQPIAEGWDLQRNESFMYIMYFAGLCNLVER